jgi:hypothetical protein
MTQVSDVAPGSLLTENEAFIKIGQFWHFSPGQGGWGTFALPQNRVVLNTKKLKMFNC